MKSGISFSMSTVRGMNTWKERNRVIEVGVWPHKNKCLRLWLAYMVTGEGIDESLTEWGWNLPKLGELWGIRRLSSLFGRKTSAGSAAKES